MNHLNLFFFVFLALNIGCKTTQLREASGISYEKPNFHIVGDGSPGKIFKYKIAPGKSAYTIDVAKTRKIAGNLAIDLESNGLLDNGQDVVLSERLHALLSSKKIIAMYPDMMSEIAGKGMEGLAVHSDKHVVGLWEGGHFEPDKIPKGSKAHIVGPVNPLFCIHSIPSQHNIEVCKDGNGVVELNVPNCPDNTQAFRAPDLVWNSVVDSSFIILLGSTNKANDEFKFKWLHKFSKTGQPIGEPLNLCDQNFLPNNLKEANFEGLDWFEKGQSLVLIHDKYPRGAPTAVIVDINPWPSTNKSVVCKNQ